MEGFYQVGAYDPDEDNGDDDTEIDDADKNALDGDVNSIGGVDLGEDEDPVDKLDTANRSNGCSVKKANMDVDHVTTTPFHGSTPIP